MFRKLERQLKEVLLVLIKILTAGKYMLIRKNSVPNIFFGNSTLDSKLKYLVEKNISMTSAVNLSYTAFLADQIVKNSISGDFCEIGVWRGGHLVAAKIGFGNQNRKLFGFDTFNGMTNPNQNEYNLNSGKTAFERYEELEMGKGWRSPSANEVIKNCTSLGVRESDLVLYEGDICELVRNPNFEFTNEISILRVDVDWEEPTKVSLNTFYKWVNHNGIVIIDDYGSWSGAKSAVDQFRFENKINSPMIHLCDSTYMWVKNEPF